MDAQTNLARYASLESMAEELEKSKYEISHTNILSMSGLNIAAEICLDHGRCTAYTQDNATDVNIHLVVSAGMDHRYSKAIHGNTSGPFFLQDGAKPSTMYYCPGCELKKEWADQHEEAKDCAEATGTKSTKINWSKDKDFSTADAEGLEGPQTSPFGEVKDWSDKCWATEGSGYGVDERFDMTKIKFGDTTASELFAMDRYKPMINFSPPIRIKNPKLEDPCKTEKSFEYCVAYSGHLKEGKNSIEAYGATAQDYRDNECN
jgi:hypothetical protein